jgi:tetratricopeptide (TPR) repeat protein
VEPEPEEPEERPDISGLDEDVQPEVEDSSIPSPETKTAEPDYPQPYPDDSFEKPIEVDDYPEDDKTSAPDLMKEIEKAYQESQPEPERVESEPDGQLPTLTPIPTPVEPTPDEIPEEVLRQLKEIREFDFDQRRIATYQKALERAWFDEKITADEQFILDGLREVLEITNEEHKIVESEILRTLEKRYSEGLEEEPPLGKIENEHERRKREIYQYFQRGSEFYETDKYFEAIIEWEKILEIEPGNPLIMKAINNARRYLDSPALEEIGAEPVYSYDHPMKVEEKIEGDKKEKKVEVEYSDTAQIDLGAIPDKSEWISQQNDIKTELQAIKTEEEKDRKKTSKIFKLAYKNYKAGKYVRAIKLWKRVLKIDPEHTKARKGLKLAFRKYKLLKKKRAEKLKSEKELVKVTARKKPKAAPASSEMEIPEVLEAEPVVTAEVAKVAGPLEMEIPEIEEKVRDDFAEPLIAEAESPSEIEPVKDELIPTEEPVETEPEPEEKPVVIEPELTVEPELTPETLETKDEEVTVVEGDGMPLPDDELTFKPPSHIEPPPEVAEEDYFEPKAKEPPLPPEEPEFVFHEPSVPEVTEVIEEPRVTVPERTTEDIIKELYEDAVNMVRHGRFSNALELLDEVIRLNPDNSEAWNDKGILLDSLDKHSEALECFEKALELQPAYNDALLNKGIALSGLNKQAEALDIFNEVLRYDSTLEEAWLNKGFANFSLRQFDQAVESLKKGLELDPRNEEGLVKLGESYQKLEQFSNASSTFEQILSLNPNNAVAIEGLSECQKNLKWELLKAWNI